MNRLKPKEGDTVVLFLTREGRTLTAEGKEIIKKEFQLDNNAYYYEGHPLNSPLFLLGVLEEVKSAKTHVVISYGNFIDCLDDDRLYEFKARLQQNLNSDSWRIADRMRSESMLKIHKKV